MTEIELYKETIKAVHNEYVKDLEQLKKLLTTAFEDDIALNTSENRKETIIAATMATLDTVVVSLRMKCDSLLAEIEREEE